MFVDKTIQYALRLATTFLFLCCAIGSVLAQENEYSNLNQISIIVEPSGEYLNRNSTITTDSILMEYIIKKTSQILNDSGVTNVYDKKTFYENIISRHLISNNAEEQDIFKIAIENAPADISLKVNFNYNTIQNKSKISIQLSAIDNYSAVILASKNIESKYRAFPNPISAVETVFNVDAKQDLNAFIKNLKLEISKINDNGRKFKVKFEIERDSKISMGAKIEQLFIEELIESCIRSNSAPNRTKIIGQSDFYLDLEVTIPPFGHGGYSSSIGFKRSILKCLRTNHIIIKSANIVGNWIVFSL